jgi:signal peptidase
MSTFNRKSKISNIIYYLVMGMFLIIALFLITSKSDKAYDLLKFRNYTILSGSMEPKYDPGDMVVIMKKNPSKLKVGDIITFTMDGEIVTHRIIEITEEGFITQGDNNDVIDAEIITDENIIGKAIFSIPKAGFVAQFLSQGWVIALEMIILGVYIFLSFKDEDKEEDKEYNYEKN